eukprot:NODE_2772_length_1123_cov_25.099628_g2545_i0.p1 GENE.NODE_2772_length_1123_cov_25.099628_g2545_i0~~NODE_2772_length_1123_cov_25.099628_g2545_i0.p1  ORF type:complete len:264 (+),score=24.41 NODE_2772_length_1123_cov_25.099628_g2545_i0:146-937(+)
MSPPPPQTPHWLDITAGRRWCCLLTLLIQLVRLIFLCNSFIWVVFQDETVSRRLRYAYGFVAAFAVVAFLSLVSVLHAWAYWFPFPVSAASRRLQAAVVFNLPLCDIPPLVMDWMVLYKLGWGSTWHAGSLLIGLFDSVLSLIVLLKSGSSIVHRHLSLILLAQSVAPPEESAAVAVTSSAVTDRADGTRTVQRVETPRETEVNLLSRLHELRAGAPERSTRQAVPKALAGLTESDAPEPVTIVGTSSSGNPMLGPCWVRPIE